MRKVCVITGTRAEYGTLKPILRAIENHPKLTLKLIVTGMHLSSEFGKSIDLIKEDGFEIAEAVEMDPTDDSSVSMAQAIGKGIIGITKAFDKIGPDIVLVIGDRTEGFAGAISSAFMNIPLAHIHGGDRSRAGLDESTRHAITKFAHIHFPATRKSGERIEKLGEDAWRIHVVGGPHLDTILNANYLSKEEFEKKFDVNLENPLILLLQHSVSTEPEEAKNQIIETLEAIKELKMQTIIIYPNSDTGGRRIIKQIKKVESLPYIRSFKNLPYIEYLSIMKYANVMVGNSSSGIIESSSFKLPVVNIGNRQEGRERSTNVIDVPHDRNEILKAIRKAIYDKKFREIVDKSVNPYGDGKASESIVKVLNEIQINKRMIQKAITY